MGVAGRWFAVVTVALTLALGFGAADSLRAHAATTQEGWSYYDNDGYGCLSRTWNGVETGHLLCGGQDNGTWYTVGFDGDVSIWDGARWVTIFWVHTDGYRSYASIYDGYDLVMRVQLMFYQDSSIGMVEVYPRDLRSMDPATAAVATAATFSGYTGSQMFSGLYSAPDAGPII